MDTTQLPVRPIQRVLAPEDEQTMRNVLQRVNAAQDQIERAKLIGMNVSSHEDRNQLHKHVAETTLALHFPPTLTPPEPES